MPDGQLPCDTCWMTFTTKGLTGCRSAIKLDPAIEIDPASGAQSITATPFNHMLHGNHLSEACRYCGPPAGRSISRSMAMTMSEIDENPNKPVVF